MPRNEEPGSVWADGHGVFHARVSRNSARPLIVARRLLRDALAQRKARVAQDVWMHPVRVPDLDTEDTIVYRERFLDTDK